MVYNLKDKIYYEKLKLKLKKYNDIWRNFSGRPYVGDCSFLYKKYRPKDYNDFWMKYINDASNENYLWDKAKGDIHIGRSIEQLENLAKLYHNAINNPKITIDMCFDDIVNHTIIETFDGHNVERYLISLLNKQGKYTVEETDSFIDSKYGIDLIIRNPKDENYIRYIQVKPFSFFIGINTGVIKDKIKRFGTEDEFKSYFEKNGNENQYRPIEYVTYDKQVLDKEGKIKILYVGGKSKFTLNELIDKNGQFLLKNYEFKYV